MTIDNSKGHTLVICFIYGKVYTVNLIHSTQSIFYIQNPYFTMFGIKSTFYNYIKNGLSQKTKLIIVKICDCANTTLYNACENSSSVKTGQLVQAVILNFTKGKLHDGNVRTLRCWIYKNV